MANLKEYPVSAVAQLSPLFSEQNMTERVCDLGKTSKLDRILAKNSGMERSDRILKVIFEIHT